MKKLYNIIYDIFDLDEFKIIKNKKWIVIDYKNENFITIYINNKERYITLYYYYEYNSLEFIDKYDLNGKVRYYNYIIINNKLKLLYEKKMIQNGKNNNHLKLFSKLFNLNI